MEHEVDFNFLFKIVVIGDSGVGKSNLMTRYTCDEFSVETPSTIGVEFMTKTLTISGRDVKAQIWDTAGQEKFRAIARSVYNGAKGAMIVYDITNQSSMNNVPSWIEELKKYADPPPVMMLIGNKCDLEHLRVVKKDTANAFAQQHGISFLETSALDSTNVEKAFDWLINEVFQQQVKNMGPTQGGGSGGSSGAAKPPPGQPLPQGNKFTLDDPNKKAEGKEKKKCC
eukprot:PhF_6_TR23779/c0_g1_i1/m.33264/K07904/RAB11A; Ras-related protein Rab-11A